MVCIRQVCPRDRAATPSHRIAPESCCEVPLLLPTPTRPMLALTGTDAWVVPVGIGGDYMKRLRTGLVTVAALMMGYGLSGVVHAEDWRVLGQFGWFGIGKAYTIEHGHTYWVGEFSGTFFNDKGKGTLFDQAGVKCPAFQDIDSNNKKSKAAGYCVITDHDGDAAYLKWQNEGDGTTGQGTFDYTGGTGKYKGISGSNTFVGVTQVLWPDGTASGYATWNR